MRFSLVMMTSGALSSMSFFKRLLRLITRRYKSLRSLVAYRPPSSGTIGRRSGGKTGKTVKNIHSGFIFARDIPLTNLNLFKTFFRDDKGAVFSSSDN